MGYPFTSVKHCVHLVALRTVRFEGESRTGYYNAVAKNMFCKRGRVVCISEGSMCCGYGGVDGGSTDGLVRPMNSSGDAPARQGVENNLVGFRATRGERGSAGLEQSWSE